MIHDVRIEMTGPGTGHVFLDGEEVHGVRKLSFVAEPDTLSVLRLEIVVLTVAISAPAEVFRDLGEVPERPLTRMERLRSLFKRRGP